MSRPLFLTMVFLFLGVQLVHAQSTLSGYAGLTYELFSVDYTRTFAPDPSNGNARLRLNNDVSRGIPAIHVGFATTTKEFTEILSVGFEGGFTGGTFKHADGNKADRLLRIPMHVTMRVGAQSTKVSFWSFGAGISAGAHFESVRIYQGDSQVSNTYIAPNVALSVFLGNILALRVHSNIGSFENRVGPEDDYELSEETWQNWGVSATYRFITK